MDGEEKEALINDPINSISRRRKRSCPGTTLLAFILIIIIAFLLGAGFACGILAWREIYDSHSSSNSSTANWGSDVTVDGNTVSVLKWLDTALEPDKIRENLKYV